MINNSNKMQYKDAKINDYIKSEKIYLRKTNV